MAATITHSPSTNILMFSELSQCFYEEALMVFDARVRQQDRDECCFATLGALCLRSPQKSQIFWGPH